MKELVKQYLDQGISRRTLMANLGAAGLSAAAANAVAQALAPVSARAAAASPGAIREVTGPGGQLYLQQLKAAGVEYYFFNPSTGDAPIFNAFVDEPAVQLIKGVQEGVVVAMADGYARLSGKVGVCSVANVGLPNGVTQLVNTYKDRIPLLLVVGAFPQDQVGRDGPQEYEHQENMLAPLTKWYWQAQSVTGIPETVRRALKFAATPPGGPVFLAIPDNMLRAEGSATVIDKALFDVPMRIRAEQKDIEAVARLLIEAKNPLLSVGDEITLCQGESEVVELAELLGLPVAGGGEFGVWSKPFPTRNSLYLGPVLANMRFPGEIDLRLNLGNQYGERRMPGTTLVSIRRDPTSLARVSPVDIALVADLKLAAADLVAAVKSLAQGTSGADRRGPCQTGAPIHQRHGGSAPGHAEGIRDDRFGQCADQAGAPRIGVGISARKRHDLRQRRRFRQEDGPLPFVRRRRQDLRSQWAKHSGLGHVGSLRCQARAT
jgi:thiamine pyrophosphate-dependent acetolactate synthase large subunit-like protein